MSRIPHNIEKLPGKSYYTGYGSGTVWHITKTNSSYGNWIARDTKSELQPVYAFRLEQMGEKISDARNLNTRGETSVTGKRNPKADPPNVMTFSRVPVGAQFRMKNVRNWRGDWSTKISKTEYERDGKTWSPTPSIKCIVRDVEITGSKNPRVKVADAMGNRWRVELTNDKGVHVYIAKGSRKTSWSFTSDQKRAKLFVTRGEAQRYFADYVKPYMDKRFHTPTFEPINYGPTRAEVLDMKISGSKNPRFGKPDPLDVRYVVRAKHENGKVYYLTADNKLDSEKSKAEKYPRSKVEAMIRFLELRAPRSIKFVDAVTA